MRQIVHFICSNTAVHPKTLQSQDSAPQFPACSLSQDDFERQLEADAKTVAVASVVLTAFVVAEAQAQGFDVQA